MSSDLVEAVLAGKPGAIARAITLVESGGREAKEILRGLRPRAGRAHLVGITGPPGAGKSTLIGRLAREFRNRGRSVGVIAADPTSPFTGGALLGDRVRMQELACDPGVFIRSMATRGRLGGLARAMEDAATVLDAAGKEMVIMETVGVGQDEVDVAGAAHTTVVVAIPGMGDQIQMLKAGVLEIGDVFVVNKADLDGADRLAVELAALSGHNGRDWIPPVLKTTALSGSGVAELTDTIDAHRTHLAGAGQSTGLRSDLVRERILAIAGRELLERVEADCDPGSLEHLIGRVIAGESDPHSAAEELVSRFLAQHGRG